MRCLSGTTFQLKTSLPQKLTDKYITVNVLSVVLDAVSVKRDIIALCCNLSQNEINDGNK